MSPRTGRPIKGQQPRTEKINLRLSKAEVEKIQHCADELGVHRVDAIMMGIDLLRAKLEK